MGSTGIEPLSAISHVRVAWHGPSYICELGVSESWFFTDSPRSMLIHLVGLVLAGRKVPRRLLTMFAKEANR